MPDYLSVPSIAPTPSRFNLQTVKPYLTVTILVIVIIAAHVLVFKLVSKSQFSRELAWKNMLQEKGAKEGNAGSGIVYILEGRLVEIKPASFVLESDGKTVELSSVIAKYTVVSAYDKFEEWPMKVITYDSKSSFKPNDQVKILIRGPKLADRFIVERIIKVQEKNE